MPLTNTQRKAVMGLVSLSASARVIADRVDKSLSAQADVQELRKIIQEMEAEIASLREELSEALNPDANFNDEEAHAFMKKLEESLKDLDYRAIVTAYDHAYFASTQKSIRVLVCTVLLNVFQTRNLTPLDVWTNIVATNGSLN